MKKRSSTWRKSRLMFQPSPVGTRDGVCLVAIVQHSDGGESHLSATASAGGTLVRRTYPLKTYVESLYEISLWLEELKREHASPEEFAFP